MTEKDEREDETEIEAEDESEFETELESDLETELETDLDLSNEQEIEVDGGLAQKAGGLAASVSDLVRSGDDDQDPEPGRAEDVVDPEPDQRLIGLAIGLAAVGAMIGGLWRLAPDLLAAIGVPEFILGLLGGASLLGALYVNTKARTVDEPIRLPDPELVERPPDILEPPSQGEKQSRFGLPGKLLAEYNVRRKRKKLGGKGYVEWYLIEDAWPLPKFIKPKTDATNLPYYEYKGERYFFPRYARLADERGGVWVAVHQRGDADPINLKEPKDHTLPAKAVAKWAELVVETKSGLFDGLFGLTPQEMFRYGSYIFIGYMVLRTALQNGVVPGV